MGFPTSSGSQCVPQSVERLKGRRDSLRYHTLHSVRLDVYLASMIERCFWRQGIEDARHGVPIDWPWRRLALGQNYVSGKPRRRSCTSISFFRAAMFSLVTLGITIGNSAASVAVLHALVNSIVLPGLINMDFSDIRAVMMNGGWGAAGVNVADGPDRCVKAAEPAFRSSLLPEVYIGSPTAAGILVDVAGHDISLSEIDDMFAVVCRGLADETIVVVGHTPDASLGNRARVTLIATGRRSLMA